MRVVPSVICVSILCGCYVTTPLTDPHPEPGSKLRVSLTDLGADSLARYLGPGVTTVDGKLLYATDSALQLSVNTVAMRSGQEQYWKGEAVSLPRIAIAHVDQRKVSWLRTALIAGGALALAASIKVSGVANGGGNTNGGGHNPE